MFDVIEASQLSDDGLVVAVFMTCVPLAAQERIPNEYNAKIIRINLLDRYLKNI